MRLIAAMVLLVFVTAGAIAALIYRNLEADILPRALDRVDGYARLLALELEATVHDARADVLGFRRDVAVDGIVRASRSPSGASADGIGLQAWRDRLAQRFVAELQAKPDYAQFRIIGVAEEGLEILPVDRMGPGGAIRIVADDALQRKGGRDYFRRAVALQPGEVYVSPVELNQEDGVIETPHLPTIRAAAPIHAPDGTPFGVVVINVDLRPAFAQLLRPAPIGGERYLVNARGDYLAHPDQGRTFGFELGTPVRV